MELRGGMDVAAGGVEYKVPSTQYSVPGTQHSVPGTQYSVPGTQYSVLSSQYSVLYPLHPVLRTRFSVLCTLYSVLCTRYLPSLRPTLRLLLAASWLIAIPLTAAHADEDLATNVGMEGVYYLRWQGPALEATPVDDDAPIVLRIANIARDGDISLYELRYIGSRAGRHDLRNSLRRVDGQPLSGMEPILVSVKNILPEDHDGELEDRAVGRVARAWHYRLILVAACVLWAVPPLWLLGRRIAGRSARQIPTAEALPLTLADQLRPLVEAAVAGRLSTLEQARLERILIAYWREQLDLAGCSIGEALARMRRHPPSAALLGKLDEWLHQRPGRHVVDVAEVLRPYGDHAPLDSTVLEAVLLEEATP